MRNRTTSTLTLGSIITPLCAPGPAGNKRAQRNTQIYLRRVVDNASRAFLRRRTYEKETAETLQSRLPWYPCGSMTSRMRFFMEPIVRLWTARAVAGLGATWNANLHESLR